MFWREQSEETLDNILTTTTEVREWYPGYGFCFPLCIELYFFILLLIITLRVGCCCYTAELLPSTSQNVSATPHLVYKSCQLSWLLLACGFYLIHYFPYIFTCIKDSDQIFTFYQIITWISGICSYIYNLSKLYKNVFSAWKSRSSIS